MELKINSRQLRLCPKCSSKESRSYGYYRCNGGRIKRYICTSCSTQYTLRSKTIFSRMRYHNETIFNALKASFEYGMSTYSVAKLLRQLGVRVSPESIRLWLKKYEKYYEEVAIPNEYTNKWHVEEITAGTGKKGQEFLVVYDSNKNLLITHKLSSKVRKDDIKNVVVAARKETGIKPEVVVSNKNVYYTYDEFMQL